MEFRHQRCGHWSPKCKVSVKRWRVGKTTCWNWTTKNCKLKIWIQSTNMGWTDKVVDGQSVAQDFWRSKTGWIPTSLLICRQVQANHPQIPNLSGLRSIALAAHQFQTRTNPNQFTVMNLIFLAWLSSVSICVGGIPAQLDCADSRLQITPFPLESPNLVSMATWKSSGDLAMAKSHRFIVEPFNFQCQEHMTVASRCSQRWTMTAGSLTFGSRQWSRKITCVKNRNSRQCFAVSLACRRTTPKQTSHLLGGWLWKRIGQCGGFARTRYVSAIRDDGVCDIFEDHRRGLSGVFKQLVEWMEWSLHGCAGHRRGNQGALQLQPDKVPHASRVCIKRLFVPGQKSCAVVAYQRWCWRVHFYSGGGHCRTAWDEILRSFHEDPDKVHSISLQRIRFTRAVPNKLEISSMHRVPAMEPLQFQHRLCTLTSQSVDPQGWNLWWHQSGESRTSRHRASPQNAVRGHCVDYEHFDFVDKNATIEDTSLLPGVPMLEAAIQQRFGLKGQEDLKEILEGLSERRIVRK